MCQPRLLTSELSKGSVRLMGLLFSDLRDCNIKENTQIELCKATYCLGELLEMLCNYVPLDVVLQIVNWDLGMRGVDA